MKKIFIYYSLTGNGDLVANYLKQKGYEIIKVITEEPLPNNFILRTLTGGYKAMINYEDKISNFNTDISNYEDVIIGSPIWNDRLSSPINTVLKRIEIKDKKLSFILYSGKGNAKIATKLIKDKFPGSIITHLKEPKNNPKELNKIFN